MDLRVQGEVGIVRDILDGFPQPEEQGIGGGEALLACGVLHPRSDAGPVLIGDLP
jgi:hypothetical protein